MGPKKSTRLRLTSAHKRVTHRNPPYRDWQLQRIGTHVCTQVHRNLATKQIDSKSTSQKMAHVLNACGRVSLKEFRHLSSCVTVVTRTDDNGRATQQKHITTFQAQIHPAQTRINKKRLLRVHGSSKIARCDHAGSAHWITRHESTQSATLVIQPCIAIVPRNGSN